MKFILLILIICMSFVKHSIAQEKILLLNGRLHVGNGTVIEQSAIGIEGETIVFVKNALAYTVNQKEWDTIIQLKGNEIYPAFVAPNSTLGLTEIDAVRATRDFDDVGSFNPHVRSQIAYNVESKVMSTVRTNGVFLTQATPRGGIISGSSSIMTTYGWNWEDATIIKDDGIHLNWPSSIASSPTAKKRNEKYDESKQEIYDFFEMAKAYTEDKNPEEIDLRLEAMRGCFSNTKRIYIHANELQEIIDLIEFVTYFDFENAVLVGGYDSHLVTRKLKDSNISVMVVRPHSLPQNEDDPIDHSFKLPALLQRDGVKFCIQNHGDMEAMNARNIPFLAGTAMAYGLSEEEAVRSITLSSCEILGIDKRYGSIEKGKSATLFVSEGNALDMRSNNMVLGLINGKFVPTTNFQCDLYRKYSKKYKQ